MNEQFAVLELAVSRLEAADIPYMVTGSIALAVYATPRMTRDIDIVIDCNADQAAALASAFAGDSYASPEAAREAADQEGMFNVIHNESLLKVDFIFRKHDAFNAARFSRRRRLDFGRFTAMAISPEDLIATGCLGCAATIDVLMTDTHPAVAERLKALYAARTPAQRVQMATSMFTSAKELARAGIRMELGDIPEPEMRRQLFLRLYGAEFSDTERDAILQVINPSR